MIITIATALLSTLVHAESKTSYDPILKASVIKKHIEIDDEIYIRGYFKPTNFETKINDVNITVQRDGEILEIIKLNERTITEESLSKEYPWEALLPIGEKYKGTEFVHNLEPGNIKFTLSANIKGKGLKVKEIQND